VRAWYAWTHLPSWLDEALASTCPSGCTTSLIPAATLQELLLELNQLQPVEASEAAAVREVALALGASEVSVEAEQLRQAIAVWYLHVERGGAMPPEVLAAGAVAEAHRWILRQSGLQQFWEGRCDRKATSTRLLTLLAFFLGAVLPSFEMWVARRQPTPVTCEHPHLGELLHATGMLGLVLTVSLLATTATTKARAHSGIACSFTFTGTTAIVNIVVHAFGLSQVLTSTGDRCGVFLWHFCHFVYLLFPSLLCVFACCGLPFLYCFVGGAELLESHSAEMSLSKVV